MAVLILTKEKTHPKDVIGSIEKVCELNNFRIDEEKTSNKNNLDLYISKDYKNPDQDNEDYFYLGLESDQIEFKENGQLYYRLGVTDQADYDHLIYDFSLGYLRLNSDHIISLYGETFFSLQDMEKLESEGGYYKDWSFGVSRPN